MLSVSRTCGRLLSVGTVTLGVALSGAVMAAPPALALQCQPSCPVTTPPPPPPTPILSVDLARQGTDERSVNVVGYADQTNVPTTPVTVEVSVDGGTPVTVTANAARSDVASAHPTWGPDHGFNVTLPASANPKQVCVLAVGRYPDAAARTCVAPDDVVKFAGTSITYNLSGNLITSTAPDTVDQGSMNNDSATQQTLHLTGSKTVTDTSSWQHQQTFQVTMSGGVGIPFLTKYGVQVQGSYQWQQGGSLSTAYTFAWTDDINVPADTDVTATVVAVESTISVPYAITGTAVYASGATAPGTITGTYTGIDSHDVQVNVTQSSAT